MPTPQACAVFPTIYSIYSSGQVNIVNSANTIHPQADKKLKLYRFLNLSKNISKSYKKTKGKTMIISN